AYARLLGTWQNVSKTRRGLDALLDAIDALQGYPLPASIFESEILAARIAEYSPADLDTLSAAGEIVWTGVEPLGERDGRIALYLTDRFPLLGPLVTPSVSEGPGRGGRRDEPNSGAAHPSRPLADARGDTI